MMLNPEPTMRASMADIISHPWFTSNVASESSYIQEMKERAEAKSKKFLKEAAINEDTPMQAASEMNKTG